MTFPWQPPDRGVVSPPCVRCNRVTLKEVRAENKKLRMTLHTTNGVLDEFKQKHAEEVASNKALHKHNKELAATVEARKQEVRLANARGHLACKVVSPHMHARLPSDLVLVPGTRAEPGSDGVPAA